MGRPPLSPRPSPTAPGRRCPQVLPWALVSLSGMSALGPQTGNTERLPLGPPHPEHLACFPRPHTRAGEAALSGKGLGFCLLSDCREHSKWLKYFQNAVPAQFSTVTVVQSTTQTSGVTKGRFILRRQMHILPI